MSKTRDDDNKRMTSMFLLQIHKQVNSMAQKNNTQHIPYNVMNIFCHCRQPRIPKGPTVFIANVGRLDERYINTYKNHASVQITQLTKGTMVSVSLLL